MDKKKKLEVFLDLGFRAKNQGDSGLNLKGVSGKLGICDSVWVGENLRQN